MLQAIRSPAYVADISGHGLQAGILMGMLKASIRTILLAQPSLPRMLEGLNAVLPGLKEQNMYTTFAALRLHEDSNEIEYILAGHPPMLYLDGSAGVVQELNTPQFPLGLIQGAEYSSATLRGKPGDSVLLVTDGILEAMDARGEEFGINRLSSLLLQTALLSSEAAVERMFAAANAYADSPSGGYERENQFRSDDQTLLLLRILAADCIHELN
jgi:serine phosphatase RsbU (regulator of sigma subunit)